jgi:hypothetical protein
VARSYGRVFPSIWNDDDFRALSMEARLMYVFLLSQPDLAQSGVIPYRTRRWGRLLDRAPAEVEGLCGELEAARFVVTDLDTEELLVRSLMRCDEVWKQPNVFKAAASSATGCESARLKAALLAEAQRLDPSEMKGEARQVLAALIAALGPFGGPPAARSGRDRAPSLEAVPAPDSPSRGETGSTAGREGSRRVREPSPKGSGELRGKVNSPLPQSLDRSPTPLASAPAPQRDAAPAAISAEGEEGGDPVDWAPAEVTALVDSIRAIRRDWSVRSIRRALDHEDVRDRPWDIVREAFAIVARDPATRQPGRLSRDGDWWDIAARKLHARPAAPAPARGHKFVPGANRWCTECNLSESAAVHRRAS